MRLARDLDHPARRQEAAVRRLVDAGAAVHYRHEFDAAGNRIPNPTLPGPKWLRSIFGNHAFWTVYSVDVGSSVTLRDVDLQPLVALGDLEVLRLGSKTTDSGLASVAGLSKLTSLQIESLYVTNRGLEYFANLKNLELLDLQYANVDDDGLKVLVALEHLKYINLLRTMVTNDGIAWLQRQLPHAHIDARCPSQDQEKEIARQLWKLGARLDPDDDGWITGVELFGPDATDKSIELVDKLSHLGGVRLRNTQVSQATINRLREHHPNIVVDPKYPDSAQDDPEAVAAIQSLTARLSFNREGFVQLAEIIGDHLTDDGLHALEKLSRLTQLQIDAAAINDADFKHLATFSTLKNLGIYNYRGTDAGLRDLVRLTGLQALTLQGGGVTDASLAIVAELTQLRSLTLIDSQVEGPGLQKLNGLASLSRLSLSGWRSAIRDDGLRYLSQLRALRTLNLYSAPITDQGLVNMGTLQSLEQLFLMNTHVTDAGLSQLKQLPKLKRLELQNTGVTKEGVEQFLKAVPQCKVQY